MTDSVDGELKHVSAEHSTGNPFCSDAVYQGVLEGHKCRRRTHNKEGLWFPAYTSFFQCISVI